ncbi:hypothetical protein HY490_01660 [Candidatus Woesearchaeota archaeon]|nr:hypothetical protein [Candidatus Woesearchaeota archaeon]
MQVQTLVAYNISTLLGSLAFGVCDGIGLVPEQSRALLAVPGTLEAILYVKMARSSTLKPDEETTSSRRLNAQRMHNPLMAFATGASLGGMAALYGWGIGYGIGRVIGAWK